MCNLYRHRITQAELRLFAAVERDNLNLPEVEEIYPDRPAPIVRQGADGVRELVTARWGMPTPPKFLEGKKSDPGVTNVRNAASSHWRRFAIPVRPSTRACRSTMRWSRAFSSAIAACDANEPAASRCSSSKSGLW